MMLPAISLWQPWASLLFAPDAKVHETRHWPARPSLLGQRVLIHAAKKKIALYDYEEALQRLCLDRFGRGWNEAFPRGAFIGTTTLASCIQIDDDKTAASINDLIAGNWAPGRYAWRFDDRMAFATPIPAKGQQGWWTAEVDLP